MPKAEGEKGENAVRLYIERNKRYIEHFEKEPLYESTHSMLDYVLLPYRALPEVSADSIDLSAKFLNRRFSHPIMISATLAADERAYKIAIRFAKFAVEKDIPFQIGTIRPMIVHPELKKYYEIKKKVKEVYYVANIGATQVVELGVEKVLEAVQDIEADALAIHLNAFYEFLNPHGDKDWRGVADAMGELLRQSPIPVFPKETGVGLDPATVLLLKKKGFEWFDVQGMSGRDLLYRKFGEIIDAEWLKEGGIPRALRDMGLFGVPTAVATYFASKHGKVVGSGGIRNGVDMARLFALGASFTAAASPFLKALLHGKLEELFNLWMNELRAVLFFTGSGRISDLRGEAIILDPLKDYIQSYEVVMKRKRLLI